MRNSYVILRAALRFLKKERFDIVQIMDTEYSISSLLLGSSQNLPPVSHMVNAANFAFSKYPGSVFWKFYKIIQKIIFKRSLGRQIKGFTVLGAYHKEELKKQFGLKESFPIGIIRDGANPPAFFLNHGDAREKIGIDYRGTIFLLFGMLRKDKGLECFLKAASLLKDQDFKILIAGSLFDYTKGRIVELISDYGIADKAELRLEYIKNEEIPFYFYASDALVLPYRKIYTGGSGPLLKEAAIYKTPVIASDVSEMGRLVKQYNMGLVAEPENAESLAQKMKDFLHMSVEQRQTLRENSFKAVRAWSRLAKDYEEFYKEICYSKLRLDIPN